VRKRKKAYYWNDTPNFGDQLAPLLLERFANLRPSWSPVCGADIVSVGSVLEHIPPLWTGWVLGTGKLYENSRLHLHTGTMTVLGVRGPLTARQCPAGTQMLGDPGLLAPDLLGDPDPEKLYDLGIVPHWSDAQLATDRRFFGSGWVTRVISPAQDPMTVIREISRCQKIVTSSLHGMIAADSFGIPRRFEPARNWSDAQGGMFKFRDYLASIGAPWITGETTTVSRLRVDDRRYELLDAYDLLGRMVRKR
jgi:polysaccharide pyruvyl transferase